MSRASRVAKPPSMPSTVAGAPFQYSRLSAGEMEESGGGGETAGSDLVREAGRLGSEGVTMVLAVGG